MARIRTIKPEFPHSETLGSISRDARLLFVNLFTIADDSGRARASSRLLASLLYPFDGDAPKLIDRWLAELEGVGAIRLYQCGDTKYLDIPKWLEHQKIDRPSKSRIPEFVEHSRALASPREASSTDLGPRTLDLGPRTLDPSPLKPPKGGIAYTEEFERFWNLYPEKVGKKAAWRAWGRAKDRPPIEQILLALARYQQNKPADREWCHPATWLNQGRWGDLPANGDGTAAMPPCPPGMDPVEWFARCHNIPLTRPHEVAN